MRHALNHVVVPASTWEIVSIYYELHMYLSAGYSNKLANPFGGRRLCIHEVPKSVNRLQLYIATSGL